MGRGPHNAGSLTPTVHLEVATNPAPNQEAEKVEAVDLE
uniref:Uncharacterized protein n=1 Tax=Arundo donax TaxID=35708 RepID=A0A0A9EIS3_ARUDO